MIIIRKLFSNKKTKARNRAIRLKYAEKNAQRAGLSPIPTTQMETKVVATPGYQIPAVGRSKGAVVPTTYQVATVEVPRPVRQVQAEQNNRIKQWIIGQDINNSRQDMSLIGRKEFHLNSSGLRDASVQARTGSTYGMLRAAVREGNLGNAARKYSRKERKLIKRICR